MDLDFTVACLHGVVLCWLQLLYSVSVSSLEYMFTFDLNDRIDDPTVTLPVNYTVIYYSISSLKYFIEIDTNTSLYTFTLMSVL